MAGARRSARVATSNTKPVYNEDELESRSGGGKRRKTTSGSSPAPKRGKKAPQEKQQTLEESLDESKPAPPGEVEAQDAELAEVIEKSKTEVSGPNGDHEVPGTEQEHQDTVMQDAPAAKGEVKESAPPDAKPSEEMAVEAEVQKTRPDELPEAPVEADGGKDQPSAEDGAPEEPKVSGEPTEAETNGTAHSESEARKPASANTNSESAIEPNASDHDTPSSILEKGILYFLFRGRVGVDDPQDVNDIARSFLVLRPLPHDAKLGDGPIGDAGNCRLIAIPKKVLPGSGNDRFLSFLEKAKVSFADLKDSFKASDYETKTAGTRHSPAMTPVGEAVYAITTTGRESHLAYILTIPEELGEVQKDVGLKERGSFIISTKNPQNPSPGNANIGKGPDFPEGLQDEFRGRRWMPTQPKHLDYVNTQILLIGESSGLNKATEVQPEDKNKTDTPLEEMEKLEGEDEIRVKHLKGDDAIFSDLDLSKKDFPKVPTTW